MTCRLVGVGLVAAALCLLVAPAQASACCFGAPDTPMTRAVTWGVVVLLGVTGGVLFAFAAFFVYLFKRSRRMLGQEVTLQRSAQPGGGY